MAKVWHVVIDGKQQGPLSNTELKALADSGQLKPRDKVWKEGLDEWVSANKIKALFLPPPPSQAKVDPTPTVLEEEKKPIEDYDPLGDTINAIASVQEAAQKKAVNLLYRLMDCIGALPLLGRVVRNRRGSVIASFVIFILILGLGHTLSLIESKTPDGKPYLSYNPKAPDRPISNFPFVEFICAVGVLGLIGAIPVLLIGAWMGCPRCQLTWARLYQTHEHLGSTKGAALVSRTDFHSDRQGNTLGQTNRLEQVAVVRSSYRFFWSCRHCGHEWATVRQQVSENW